jgi:phage tail-like protein
MLRSAARSKGKWVAMLVALVLGFALIVVLISPGSHPKPAQAQPTPDPLTVARASLIMDDIEVASFSKVDELTSSMTVPKLPSGTGEQLPAEPKRKPMRIVLERPDTGRMEMAAWYESTAEGQTDAFRKNATLVFYDGSGTPVLKFYLQNAWPAEYHIEQQGTQVVERVRLTAESFHRMPPS